MGCDIHLHIEVKIQGKWLHYGCPMVDRRYDAFAYMANVRNYDDIEPISYPKGLPEDVSEMTRFCYAQDEDHYSLHGMSWLDKAQIELLEEWFKEQVAGGGWQDFNYHFIRTYLCGNGLTCNIKGVDDVRLVFWFDN